MRELFLTKIRLSWYLKGFFVLYFVALLFLPRFEFTGAALTLFSVNSFLYGFYISPVLSAQKSRIEELHRIVRSEANAIFAMMLLTRKFSAKNAEQVRNLFDQYVMHSIQGDATKEKQEKVYEQLITLSIDHKGVDSDNFNILLDKLVTNQQNRTNLSMQLNNRVYSNEWWIMMILFSITLSFILLIDTGETIVIKLVTALLCTGLSMLVLNLVKLNSLTHKKAKQIWLPFKTLVDTKYYRID